MAAALAMAGCAGRPSGNLIVVNSGALSAKPVDILVATTRAEDLIPPGIMFNGERGHGLAFADIAVSIPPDAVRKIGECNGRRRFQAIRRAISSPCAPDTSCCSGRKTATCRAWPSMCPRWSPRSSSRLRLA